MPGATRRYFEQLDEPLADVRIEIEDDPTSAGAGLGGSYVTHVTEKERETMNGRFRWMAVPLGLLAACALIAAGCGGGDDSTSATTSATTSSESSDAAQRIDAFSQSCTEKSQQLGGDAGFALAAACSTVSDAAKQALASGSAQVDQALAQAEDSCQAAVDQLKSEQAKSTLSDLCQEIGG
jgi:hypothetical protein